MNMQCRVVLLVAAVLAVPGLARAQSAGERLAHSIEELRHVVGRWAVTTQFLNPDGSPARTVRGAYQFDWVVPDRVVRGRSDIPELKQSAGILFYVNETAATIEMVSVGADGQLWIMTGPLGGDRRETAPVRSPDGGTLQLRFTRSHVTPTRFESRMERSSDGGKTWIPGNHQVFARESP